jgi:hypothetical protein
MDILTVKNSILENLQDKLYQKIKRKKPNKKYWLTIIIPVRGRVEFLTPLVNSLKKSISNYNRKVNIIVVEESKTPQHKENCKINNVDYFFIESDNFYFNKSLCNNSGAMLYKNSEYFLFHDLDCLVKEDFILNVFENIKNKKINCIQTFDKRRVLYFNEDQTKKIKNGEIKINDIVDNDLKEGDCCAPGGSILIKNSLFFEVGGYDPELFYGWSPEDLFFWDKVQSIENIGICDEPKNEIYHMYHLPQHLNVEQINNSEEKRLLYESITKENIIEIIKIKKDIIKDYI